MLESQSKNTSTNSQDLNSYLQELWLRAYKGERFIVDYTARPEGSIQANGFYNSLANYRKRLRKHRLNPLMKDEWARIERCELIRLSPTSFYLTKKHNLLFSRKRLNFIKRLPLNILDLPNSVVYL